jgi:hypothetical protein
MHAAQRTLVMEVMLPSKTLVLTRATQHHIPEDGILQFLCNFRIVKPSFPSNKSVPSQR